MNEVTYSMIKPDAFDNAGVILGIITNGGFVIEQMEMEHLTRERAEEFYAIHKDKPFFEDLISYMTSGNVLKLALSKENAVADFRTMIGATNPQEAAEGTIRAIFGTSLDANAIHGSDSVENAQKEIELMFANDCGCGTCNCK